MYLTLWFKNLSSLTEIKFHFICLTALSALAEFFSLIRKLVKKKIIIILMSEQPLANTVKINQIHDDLTFYKMCFPEIK